MSFDSHLDAARRDFHAGRLDECIAECDRALVGFPGSEVFLTLKAMALQAQGRYPDAAEVFRALAAAQPGAFGHWSNLGLMLRYAGRLDEAREAFRHSLAIAPRAYDTLINYGLLLLDMGRLGEARHRFLDALEVEPHSPEAAIYAAGTCFECGDIRRAAELIPPPAVWPVLDADLRHDLAMALINVGRVDEAERLLDPSHLADADPKTLARLAMLHERTNRLDSAEALLARVRAQVGEDDLDLRTDALTVESALAMRRRDYPRARAVTDALLALSLPPAAQASAWYTLATIADKEKRPDEAMAHLARAHALQLQLAAEMVPEVALSDDEPLRIATKWMRAEECGFADAPLPAASASPASPVFIVGFPRSGTTMLEQMLDAHPRYASMDEQPILQRCIERMQALGHEYPHALERLDAAQLEEVRAVYWHEVGRVLTLAEGQVLVDKNPLNLLRLPMIARLFPDARIILALRHPCDVVLSCYMQNFRSPAFMTLCSSLERLSKSYVNSMQNWIHHQALLRPNVLRLQYEETVADFPHQVERIAAFLGIEDHDHLARFSEHAAAKGYISTPSYAQVIEPVNTRARGRWQMYRRYFEPVLPILQPVADHWGYGFDPA
jgi:tetratricopeptide (TPR) repeat protein